MAAQLYANDAGTARQIVDWWVNDAGTARRIKEVWVNDNGTARQIYQHGDTSFTLTAGDNLSGGVGNAGYDETLAIGTLSPSHYVPLGTFAGLSDSFADLGSGPQYIATSFSVSGLSADPGQSAFTSLAIGATTLTTAGVLSYSYSSGTAIWVWSSGSFFSSGSSYTITYTR